MRAASCGHRGVADFPRAARDSSADGAHRATDNRLKNFFVTSEVRYGGTRFQGKGFERRSGGHLRRGVRLRRGEGFRGADGAWRGDVVAR